MKKVKVSGNWDSSQNITERLVKQFKTSDEDTSNIEFVYDESYDLIVFINHINQEIKLGSKVFVFPHEPTWSGSHQKYFDGINEIKIFGFDKNYYSPPEIVDESIAHTFYGGRGPWVDKLEDWSFSSTTTYDKIIKTKNISSVVTNLKDKYSDECTYDIRYEVTDFLIDNTDFIDFYGGWLKNEKCYTLPQKKYAVQDYKFSIIIENQFIKNWISEKFYDCVMTNTIPIYYGCKNIKEYYPENGYILIDDINNKEKILEQIKYINENSDELYDSMLPELKKIRTKYFQKYNFLKKINDLCK